MFTSWKCTVRQKMFYSYSKYNIFTDIQTQTFVEDTFTCVVDLWDHSHEPQVFTPHLRVTGTWHSSVWNDVAKLCLSDFSSFTEQSGESKAETVLPTPAPRWSAMEEVRFCPEPCMRQLSVRIWAWSCRTCVSLTFTPHLKFVWRRFYAIGDCLLSCVPHHTCTHTILYSWSES